MRIRHIFPLSMILVAGIGAGMMNLSGADLSKRSERFTITEQPIFPLSLANAGVTSGSASFMILASREGELMDFILLEATHLKFGESLASVLPKWDYHPIEVAGRRVNATSRIDVNFHSSGSVVSFSVADDVGSLFRNRKLVGQGNDRYEVAELKDLDQMPEPIYIVEPRRPHPELVGAEALHVLYTFFIDDEGAVRMPTFEDAGGRDVDAQILAAIQEALEQWKFKPPTIDGNAVVVRVQQPFRFVGTE